MIFTRGGGTITTVGGRLLQFLHDSTVALLDDKIIISSFTTEHSEHKLRLKRDANNAVVK